MPALLTRMSSRPCRSTIVAGQLLERRRVGHVERRPPRRVPPGRRRSPPPSPPRGRRAPRRRPSRPARPAASAIARPMPRDAPVTSATLPVEIEHVWSLVAASASIAARSSGAPKLTTVRLAVNLAHQPAQHRARTHLNIRCDAFGRKAADDGFPAHRRRHLRDQRLDRRRARRASARRRRWRRPARAGRATRSARSSGASRSSAGFISAQWNGALTGSGIDALARRAPSRARRRAPPRRARRQSRPGRAPFRFAGLTTSPSAASSHACATASASRPRIAAIAPVADRHRLLHVAAAAPDDAQRVGERERAGRDVRRVLAEAVAGDERRRDARATRAAGTPRC